MRGRLAGGVRNGATGTARDCASGRYGGCAPRCVPPPAPPPPVFVTRTAPLQELTLEQQQVLFWDDATRSARFRKMEDYFPGTEVKARSKRTLPRGDALPAASMA